MKPELRSASAADVPAINAIEKTTFPCPWSERTFYGEMENELSRFKVLDLGGEIAGYYDLWICADEAHLLNLAVAAPHRRRGYGERMLKDVIDEALGAGCARVVLEVRSSNAAAVGLYAKFGFTKIGRRPHYYADGEAADVMLKNL